MKSKIEKILIYVGLSPSQFADEIGVQRSSISHILSERNKPSLELIQKVLTKFKEINPEWLILGKGEMLRETVQRSLFANTLIETPEKVVEQTPKQDNSLQTASANKAQTSKQINDLTTNNSEAGFSVELETDKIEQPNLTNNRTEREVEKIIIFYKDNTFRLYQPE